MNLRDKQQARSEHGTGLLLGFSAYVIWGIVPIYWPELQPAGPVEILSHRILWSLIFLAGLVVVQKKLGIIRDLLTNRRTLALLTLASILIAVNWGIFIWCSVTGRLLDSSLGYFINPLFSVVLGVVFFSERLRRLQWFGLSIALAGVIYMSVVHGKPPFISLSLAFTFGLYGYVKKLANVPSIESLTVETLILAPVALGYLGYLSTQGTNTFAQHGASHMVWLASAGLVTAIPLLMFGGAAIRIPLSTLGLLQYIGPTIQFFLGLYYFNENMPVERFIGFVITWTAVTIVSVDMWRNRVRNHVLVTEPD